MLTVKPQLTLGMRLARWLLGLFGWHLKDNLPPMNKYILVGAWHTSNWDFPLAIFAMWGLGVKLHFIGKASLLKGIFGPLMKALGIIGVDRVKTVNFVQKMAELFNEREELRLVIAAEGTRSQADYWRTGFYYIALAAKVPIAFAFIDAKQKEIGIDGYFIPTADRESDLAKVKAFFESKQGLKPHKQGKVRFKELEPKD